MAGTTTGVPRKRKGMTRTIARRTSSITASVNNAEARWEMAASASPPRQVQTSTNNTQASTSGPSPPQPPAAPPLSPTRSARTMRNGKPKRIAHHCHRPFPRDGRPPMGVSKAEGPLHRPPTVPLVPAQETSRRDDMGVGKRTGTLAGSGVTTARAAALLDVERATPASHTQRVRLGRALTKTARALGHLGGSSGGGVSTPG